MVKITIFQDSEQNFTGFDCIGHAGYAEENDIVCAGVSALVINCINSIETLTDAPFTCDSQEEAGRISFRFTGRSGADAQLLVSSLALGLSEIENSCDEFIDVIFEEV